MPPCCFQGFAMLLQQLSWSSKSCWCCFVGSIRYYQKNSACPPFGVAMFLRCRLVTMLKTCCLSKLSGAKTFWALGLSCAGSHQFQARASKHVLCPHKYVLSVQGRTPTKKGVRFGQGCTVSGALARSDEYHPLTQLVCTLIIHI